MAFSFSSFVSCQKPMGEKQTGGTWVFNLVSLARDCINQAPWHECGLTGNLGKYQTCGLRATRSGAVIPRGARMALGGRGSSWPRQEAANRTGCG